MEWILPLLLGLLCLVEYPSVLGQGSEPMEVLENSALDLPCASGNINFFTRNWYRGYFNRSIALTPDAPLFAQRAMNMTRLTKRTDMSINPSIFTLTISKVHLEDDGYFTCRVFDNANLSQIYNQIKIGVYIQPRIALTGLEQRPYKENETVTVECIIDRLYPQIQPANFTMTWGDTVMEARSVQNTDPDRSYRYGVEMTKPLTKEDNGMTVTCKVNPVMGEPVTEKRTLNVQYISSGSPHLSVSNENPFREDSVTFTCNKGSVNGNPAVTSVGLYMDGNLTDWSDNSSTITKKVSLSDSGMYSCVVGNKVFFSEFSNSVLLNVSDMVNPNPSPGPVSGQSNLVPAIAGGVAGALLLFLIIVLVVFCRRRRSKDDQGSSTDALTKGQTLDRVVVPPEDFGDAQYTDIEQPAKFKPTPAQRSFRKKPEPIYDVANVNNGLPENEKTLYANVNGAHIPDQSNPPKKPKRQPELANNNTNKQPDGVVYAELDLDKKRQPKNDTRGVMPNREEPTEYARIDFTKSAKQ